VFQQYFVNLQWQNYFVSMLKPQMKYSVICYKFVLVLNIYYQFWQNFILVIWVLVLLDI